MKIDDFKLERYFAEYEFNVKYLMSCSDCDGYSLKYILDIADSNELKLWENQTFGYTESSGHPLLRESISQQYKTMAPDNIWVASPGEANFILMNTLLGSSDHAVCMAPCYQSLYQVAKSLNCELSYWNPDNDSWSYNPETLRKLIKPNTKLIIINFPHNPTGALPSKEDLYEIVKIAKEKNIYLFSDEMYSELILDGSEKLPSVCDLYENGISLWGMAKSFGLAGLRIGWFAAKNIELLQRIASFKDYLSICSSTSSEILSIIALNHKDDFINPNISKIKKNIGLFKKFVEMNSDFIEFTYPKAGSIGFAKLNIKESTLEFSRKLIEKTGILTVPAEMFDYGDKHLRIGFGRESFSEVLNVFDNYLNNNLK